MKIDLRKQKLPPCWKDCIQWKRSLPFLVNPRGHLVHRVRSVITFVRDGVWSHDAAHFWCGSGARGQFTADPPKDRLLCVYCEQKAVAAGEKSASELTGRHVCIGAMKVKRLCCLGNEN